MIFQMKDGGRHIAYSPLEAKSNEDNGWKTVTEEEFYRKDSTLNEEYFDKFGKKPHHKMTEKSIKKALDAEIQ